MSSEIGLNTIWAGQNTLDFHEETGEVWYRSVIDRGHVMKKVDRIDVEEFNEHYKDVYNGRTPSVVANGIDILDVGYWLKDGTYEPPEADWRKEVALKLSEAKA